MFVEDLAQSAAETLQMLWKCKEQNQLNSASALRPSLWVPAALELINLGLLESQDASDGVNFKDTCQ